MSHQPQLCLHRKLVPFAVSVERLQVQSLPRKLVPAAVPAERAQAHSLHRKSVPVTVPAERLKAMQARPPPLQPYQGWAAGLRAVLIGDRTHATELAVGTANIATDVRPVPGNMVFSLTRPKLRGLHAMKPAGTLTMKLHTQPLGRLVLMSMTKIRGGRTCPYRLRHLARYHTANDGQERSQIQQLSTSISCAPSYAEHG